MGIKDFSYRRIVGGALDQPPTIHGLDILIPPPSKKTENLVFREVKQR
jgi:hypothetical protein